MTVNKFIEEALKIINREGYDYDDPLVSLFLNFRVEYIAKKYTTKEESDKTFREKALEFLDQVQTYSDHYSKYGDACITIIQDAIRDFKEKIDEG